MLRPSDERLETILERLLQKHRKELVAEVGKEVIEKYKIVIVEMAARETTILLTERAWSKFGQLMFNKITTVLSVAGVALSAWLYSRGYFK